MRLQLPAVLVLVASLAYSQTPAPSHDANFDAERKQANDLYVAGKVLEALPLYEDLCRQDQTVAVFAERHGAGLMRKAQTITTDDKLRDQVFQQGMAEIRRAQKLGDNSPYVQSILSTGAKTLAGSIVSGVALSPGYTYHGTPAAQAALKEAEADFGKGDVAAAIPQYQKATALDPKWYDAPLYTGDAYFRMKEYATAGAWFQKAIDIDPDRDTAYRYWGDALYRSGEPMKAQAMYERAVVAEPYAKASWLSLQQWINAMHTPASRVRVTRPEIHTVNGVLQSDSALENATNDGRSSWLLYEKSRVAHGGMVTNQIIVGGGYDASGKLTPTGYRHSIAEEAEAIHAMLADVRAKLAGGKLEEARLDPSIKTLMRIDHDGMIECWVALDAADAGIRSDYGSFRDAHRDLLVKYVDKYLLQG